MKPEVTTYETARILFEFRVWRFSFRISLNSGNVRPLGGKK